MLSRVHTDCGSFQNHILTSNFWSGNIEDGFRQSLFLELSIRIDPVSALGHYHVENDIVFFPTRVATLSIGQYHFSQVSLDKFKVSLLSIIETWLYSRNDSRAKSRAPSIIPSGYVNQISSYIMLLVTQVWNTLQEQSLDTLHSLKSTHFSRDLSVSALIHGRPCVWRLARVACSAQFYSAFMLPAGSVRLLLVSCERTSKVLSWAHNLASSSWPWALLWCT